MSESVIDQSFTSEQKKPLVQNAVFAVIIYLILSLFTTIVFGAVYFYFFKQPLHDQYDMVSHIGGFYVAMFFAQWLSIWVAQIYHKRLDRHKQGFNQHLALRIAPLHKRLWAYLIDYCLQAVPFAVLMLFFIDVIESLPKTMSEDELGFAVILYFLFGYFLFFAMGCLFILTEAVWGKTPGKWIFKLRVVDQNGSPAGFVKALVRSTLRFADFLTYFLVSYCFMVGRPATTSLGDMAAKTVVIDESH